MFRRDNGPNLVGRRAAQAYVTFYLTLQACNLLYSKYSMHTVHLSSITYSHIQKNNIKYIHHY